MKILLVEVDAEHRLVAEREFARLGHSVICTADGAEALQIYVREQPDLVVTEVAVPGMDGFELARAVQRHAAPRWQPVLFLSSRRDEAAQVQAFESGADGYLVKPVSIALLEARLSGLDRLLAIERRAGTHAGELERFYAAEIEEKRIAEHLIRRLVNADKLNDPAIRHWISPAALFSGDVIAAARTPGNVLHVLLADAIGHGLSASINVLPVIAPFYRMTEKGFGIDAIVREMNAKVRQFLPEGRFVAATMVAVDFREGYVRVWNGGNPEPLLLNAEGHVEHAFAFGHLPLGVADDAEFEATIETRAFGPGAQFAIFSDGMMEAESADGEPFGLDRLKTALAQTTSRSRLDGVMAAVCAHVGDHPASDDISILLVERAPEADDAAEASPVACPAAVPAASGNWRFSLRLGPSEMRKLDVVPLLLELANQFDGTRERSGELFIVLSELFSNALDHGLLQLDSRQKSDPEGMERYFEQRHLRLAALDEGEIEVDIEQFELADDSWLRIVCRDSGPGFDHSTLSFDRTEASLLPFGRGIGLIRAMSASFEFNDAGNVATAILPLSRGAGGGSAL